MSGTRKGPPLPSLEDVVRYAAAMQAPADFRAAVLAARTAYDTAPRQVQLAVLMAADEVRAGLGEIGHDLPSPVPARQAGEPGGGAAQVYGDVLALLACIPSLLGYHASHAVPEPVSWATLGDLPRHVARHGQLYGQEGFSELHWLTLHLRGLLYDLGRLQFERIRAIPVAADQAALLAAMTRSGALGEGEVLLNVHIPATGPLDPRACDAAYARAAEVLPVWFPQEFPRAFCCHSWLLDPQLREYLPRDSNIVRFQDRYEVVGPGVPASRSMQEFVFTRSGEVDLDTLPQRSTLERAFLAHLRDGGTWYARTGWFAIEAR